MKGHPQSHLLEAEAVGDRNDLDQLSEVRAPLIGHPRLDVVAHRLKKMRPVGREVGRPEHPDTRLQPGGPRRVQQRTEIEIVVRVEMGDEDQRKVAQVDALPDDTRRAAVAAIDHDVAPVEMNEGRCRHRAAGIDGGATLHAQECDEILDIRVHRHPLCQHSSPATLSRRGAHAGGFAPALSASSTLRCLCISRKI